MDGKEKKEAGRKQAELTCIRCPIGCLLTVTELQDGSWQVSGNTCKRGEEYGKKELSNPTRIVTSTVRVKGGNHPMVPVKTKEDIPKAKIMECVEALREIEVEAPVHIGNVILRDAAGTGVDIVATRNIEQRPEEKRE